MKKKTGGQGWNQGTFHSNIPKGNLLDGSVAGKYPVIINNGKTIVFISDKSKEAETRLKYEIKRKM